MCFFFSGFVFRNCGYNFDFSKESDVFCESGSVLCWFLCESFDRKEKRLVV